MSAQPSTTLIGLPDLKIGIEGSFDAPTLVNNSGRTIIGYTLHVEDDSAMQSNIPVYRISHGIAPGTRDVLVRVDDLGAAQAAGRQALPRHIHRDGTPVVVSRTSLDSVIFADGEFAGPDVGQSYRFSAAHIDATRDFAVQALADMTRVETAVHAYLSASLRERFYRRGKAAEQLIATAAESTGFVWHQRYEGGAHPGRIEPIIALRCKN